MDLISLTYSNYNNPGPIGSLSLLDIIVSLIWIALILIGLKMYKDTRKEADYKYFIPFFLFKVVSLLGLAVIYMYFYKGGDNIDYWKAANALVELSLEDPIGFFREMISSSKDFGVYTNELYKNQISYPGWIMREAESNFVSKLTWFFCFISGKQYLLTSLYFMFFSFLTQWRFYRLIRVHFIKNPNTKFHILFLFIPSVAFWCNGITKDALILIGILNLSYYLIRWFILKERKFRYWFWIILYSFLIFRVREAILVVVLFSFFLMLILTIVNAIKSKVVRIFIRVGIALSGVGVIYVGLYFFGLIEFYNYFMNEAIIIQQDFTNNYTYTGDRYNLGITDFSVLGLILVSPMAVISGIFRPFIWEALSSTLILNGLESILLIYLFIKNIVLQLRGYKTALFSNRIIMFATICVILYALIIGFTAVIFGVLVRLRAPLLLFFVIALYWKDISDEPIKKTKSIPEPSVEESLIPESA